MSRPLRTGRRPGSGRQTKVARPPTESSTASRRCRPTRGVGYRPPERGDLRSVQGDAPRRGDDLLQPGIPRSHRGRRGRSEEDIASTGAQTWTEDKTLLEIVPGQCYALRATCRRAEIDLRRRDSVSGRHLAQRHPLPTMRHAAFTLDHGAHSCVAIVRHTPEVDAYYSGSGLRQQGELGPRHAHTSVREELIGESNAAGVDDLRPRWARSIRIWVCPPAKLAASWPPIILVQADILGLRYHGDVVLP